MKRFWSTEITDNFQQIIDVVQSTARGSQETVAAARQLSDLSSELQHLIGQFHLES